MTEKKDVPPIVNLSYPKGELVIKEGDYGSSIYKILSGRVRVFKGSQRNKTTLAILERGEIFGEMAFFDFGLTPRSASVEAIDGLETEVWHPARLSKEYANMPPMLRYIAKQTLKRLVRMNKIVQELAPDKEKEERVNTESYKRKYFRKKWNQEIIYGPVGSSCNLRLCGIIKDVSLNGVGIEVPYENTKKCKHTLNGELITEIQLCSEKTINTISIIRSIRRSEKLGCLFLGLEFKDASRDLLKQISRFMMF
ncbi:MAG TPA: cyclic nucleotide-binding domain-containing protein [Desulfatiglandales bacterium]|nr:cyclic nucleotide-binding domain-containing protein [Desulfatiglandales bacterium]